jgi:hypothetical protein
MSEEVKLLPQKTGEKEPTWNDIGGKAKRQLKFRLRLLGKAATNIALFPFRVVKLVWDIIF